MIVKVFGIGMLCISYALFKVARQSWELGITDEGLIFTTMGVCALIMGMWFMIV